ncbi:hypothetical protein E8E11_011445 [Didymella keratinophila]|nr:hypothetical protein E8E11_011445 [Didymella keratinophila]
MLPEGLDGHVTLLDISVAGISADNTAINAMAGFDFEYCPEPRWISLQRPGSDLAQRKRNSQEVFNFSESQISPGYMELDGNRASRSGLFSAVDCSSRGFRIGDWSVHHVDSRRGKPGPRQGSLKRRPVPAPEDRTSFPTLLREDKHEERRLLRRTRKTKVKILQDAQQKHHMEKLDEEEAKSKKLKGMTKPVAEKEAKQSEEDRKRKRIDEETAKSITRMKLVIVEVDDIIKQMEQLRIEHKVFDIAHWRVM